MILRDVAHDACVVQKLLEVADNDNGIGNQAAVCFDDVKRRGHLSPSNIKSKAIETVEATSEIASACLLMDECALARAAVESSG